MEITRIAILAGSILASSLTGCAAPPGYGIGAPVLDSHFGDAATRAWAMQVVNPDGVTPNDQGYSGRSAQTAMERHHVPPGKEQAASQEKSGGSSATSEKSGR